MKLRLVATGAFKPGRDVPLKGQAAAFAEGRFDRTHLRTAPRADEAFNRRCPRFVAELADLGINKGQRRIQPAFNGPAENIDAWH